jgi:hypothetical protein
LVTALIAVDYAGDRFGAAAIGGADRQKHQHDQHDQAAHEGQVADDRSDLRIAQRGAGRNRQERDNDELTTSA